MLPRTGSAMRLFRGKRERKAADLALLLIRLDQLACERRPSPSRAQRVSLGALRS